MSKWVHPDRLDRVAATGGAVPAASPMCAAVVARILRKGAASGRLHRLPRKAQHRNVVLAALCLGLRRRHPYAEPEVNEHVRDMLGRLHVEVDHATCRRHLVDVGFLKRNRPGTRYLLDYPRIETLLTAEAVTAVLAFIEHLHDGARS